MSDKLYITNCTIEYTPNTNNPEHRICLIAE